jgi:hypothetical protein
MKKLTIEEMELILMFISGVQIGVLLMCVLMIIME